jgi:protein YibB
MNDITIVTAFFDIGRGDWSPDKGLPGYLQRTTDTYMERFGHLAKLDNQIIIYTTEDQVDRIAELRKGKEDKTKIISIPFKDMFPVYREKIERIQKDEDYLKQINPNQIRNPEYWSVDYVLVNLLKSHFVNDAIDNGYVDNDMVSWIDFGYCRTIETLNGSTSWSYPFNPEKIHFFDYRDYQGQPIQYIIANNIVHMLGAKIVASKSKWETLQELIFGAFNNLTMANLVDDDQTLMLLAYLYNPEIFELHRIDESDPFVMFRRFNEIKS